MKKTPFSAKELTEYKKLLLDKKVQLLKEIQEQSEEVSSEKLDEPGDLVDMATDLLDQELNLSLTTAEIESLKDIDDALSRIENKTYGICIDTGEEIAKARLKVVPEAKRTLQAQEKYDKLIKEKKKKAGM